MRLSVPGKTGLAATTLAAWRPIYLPAYLPRRPGPEDVASDGGGGWAGRLARADRSCCCLAWPLVAAVMPPSSGRPHPVELLLCGHHYRASVLELLAAGAAVYDRDGVVIPPAGENLAAAGAAAQRI